MGTSLRTVFEVYRAHLYIQRGTMKIICLGLLLAFGLVSSKPEPIPIQMKDDNVTMPHLLVPDLDRAEADCGKNVKPDANGFYEVDGEVMTEESWMRYCKELKSDRNVLDEDLDTRAEIPNSRLTAKIWYDDTFLDHPDIKKSDWRARNYINKVMEQVQKWMCLSSLGFQLTVDVVKWERRRGNMVPSGDVGDFWNNVIKGGCRNTGTTKSCEHNKRIGGCKTSTWTKQHCKETCNICRCTHCNPKVADIHLGFIKTCKDGAGGWGITGGICGSSAAIACHSKKSDIKTMGIIMAHEIGHVIGANHCSSPNGIMLDTASGEHAYWSTCATRKIKEVYNEKRDKNNWCLKAISSRKCNDLMKTNCGGGLKAPSCHYCYSKYGTRSCGGDCEYNPYIGRCEKKNNGCFDKITYCENYNPNSGSCKNSRFTGGKCSGQAVGDCCKKSCGKCGGSSSNCKDNNSRCPGWTSYCSWHSWVKSNCKKTCKLC